MVDTPAEHEATTPTPEIRAAVDAWAKSIFGAPRRLSNTIVSTQPRDEILHRVVTHVVRRDLQEQRIAAPRTQLSEPQLAAAQVDPFAETRDSLKTKTSHIVSCSACHGSGSHNCSQCRGRKTVACSGCGGVGRYRNPKTNRLNKCKSCKATGIVSCPGCSGSGRVSCRSCKGSGRQWAWLVYVESARPQCSVTPQTPVVVAHPQLLEPRKLNSLELADFVVESEAHADGPLDCDNLSLGARSAVSRELGGVDARLERVVWQQHLQLAVRRLDVVFEMAGTHGTLSLSGASQTGATTPEALRPIRRRLVLWLALGVGFAVLGGALARSGMGDAPYFDGSNRLESALWLGSVALSVPWLGGLLRSWRPIVRVDRPAPLEQAAAIAWLLLFSAMPIAGWVLAPTPQAIEAALAAEDLDEARLVLDGLIERRGRSTAALQLEDQVLLAEASRSKGEERLDKLDAVVANGGVRAAQAAAIAREARLGEVVRQLEQGEPDAAIAGFEANFGPAWRDDPEVAEQHARAQELRAESCDHDVCRLVPLRLARLARETPARVANFEQTHTRLLEALSTPSDEEALGAIGRIQTSDELTQLAESILAHELGDQAISSAARTALTWATKQRASVSLYNAEVETLRAFFPRLSPFPIERVLTTVVDGALLYFVLDANSRCKGIYAVGPARHRELDAEVWNADKILSQAFGKHLSVVARESEDSHSTTWKVDKVPVVVRWRGSKPLELRIGEAKP